ncbi:hypothetical protein CYMTET_15026 [Cymbomonas tetramitiformis]|uniref:Uncharacterized protein n=1 Tax=Cymbomonas tetramitiformis TaxID=36881 RepID=A0AAE0L9Q9_9CHLO|nr:hypothetical protein CYMTET_15026 [Cymbomonas tetramitiformis]
MGGSPEAVEMVQAAGGTFLMRRFADQCWPLLARLIARGPPAPVDAITGAAAITTGRLVHAESATSASVHRIQLAALRCVQSLASTRHSGEEAATAALVAIAATVDADLVWYELANLAWSDAESTTLPTTPQGSPLPDIRELLPWKSGDDERCSATARALLVHVGKLNEAC